MNLARSVLDEFQEGIWQLHVKTLGKINNPYLIAEDESISFLHGAEAMFIEVYCRTENGNLGFHDSTNSNPGFFTHSGSAFEEYLKDIDDYRHIKNHERMTVGLRDMIDGRIYALSLILKDMCDKEFSQKKGACMSRVRFREWECVLFVEKYSNGNTAIELADEEGTVAMATVNLADGVLPENQAYIKDYSENEGMLQALKDAGIVKYVIGYKQSGFEMIPLCELDMDKLAEYTYKEEE